ncbi:MAG: beta-lactamase family protein [Chitinophagaceae bacterium]|nr:beta-lactamase family protein [Chitinophagaceae bacterium]
MIRKLFISLFTAASFCLASFQGWAQPFSAEDQIKAIMDEHHTIGLSVVVVKKGKTDYVNSFGWKNKESGQPLRPEHILRIASISKSFTATAVLQLADRKKLSLSDDIGKLLGFPVRNPKFPDKPITVEMLLNHRSSLNDSQGYFTLDVIHPEKNQNREKCFNAYEPGTQYQYCNLNFNIAGAIVEKVSGERFDQYIKKHLLAPLKLEGSFWVDELDSARLVTLYAYNDSLKQFIPQPMAYASRRDEISRYVIGYSAPVFSPTGGMKITAPDLAKWMMMHMKKGKYNGIRILRKKTAIRMQQPSADTNRYGYAIGTTTKLIPGAELKGHLGIAYGLYSAMFFHPKKKYGFVVITNGSLPGNMEGFHPVIYKTIGVLYNARIKNKNP